MGQTALIIEFPEDIVREVEEILKIRGGTFSDFVNEAIQSALGGPDADGGASRP